jgi:8-oxo-dGTP pyrophosphatase MutT (NUDIX family)
VLVERDSVRVLVFDSHGSLLLLHTTDPAEPERGTCWELPGGGIDEGETTEEAAKRELREETGIVVDDVGSCLAVVEGSFDFNGRTYRQHEHVFRVDVRDPKYEPSGFDGEIERAAHLGHRWWPVADVLATDENLYPPGLAALVMRAGLPLR